MSCQACSWWQTTGRGTTDANASAEERRRWMLSLEPAWGSTGLLLSGSDAANLAGGTVCAPPAIAAVHYGPATALPRLHDLGLTPLPAGAVLLFCLKSEGQASRGEAKRLLHKAMALLRERGFKEVYAVATRAGDLESSDECRFFRLGFLQANGFQPVRDVGKLLLMRADLRGLVSLVTQLEAALRRVVSNEPAPTPAAWTRRGAT